MDYPWLNTLVNEDDCEGTSIAVYDQGSYAFIHVQTNEGGSLYLNDGTLYCTDSPGFSCVTAYGLGAVTDEWDCDGNSGNNNIDPVFTDYPWLSNIIDETNCEGSIINIYDQGTYVFVYIQTNEGGSLYLDDGTLYCTDSPGFSCTTAYGLSSPTTTWECGGNSGENNNPIFNTYTWLNNLVDQNNCEGTSINVYDQGTYVFIYIQTANGGNLYLGDGTFYCSDSPGFSCVTAYGLGAASDTWNCGDTSGGENTDPIFTDYPWLSNLIDEGNCTGSSITVYDQGTYAFIYVQTTDGGTLYLGDGTLYCTDAPGFSCVTAYGLTTPTTQWTCPMGRPVGETEEADKKERITPALSMQLYPNPSNGIVNLSIEHLDETEASIQLYNLEGRLIEQWMLEANTPFIQLDVQHLENAYYLLELTSAKERVVKRLIIQK